MPPKETKAGKKTEQQGKPRWAAGIPRRSSSKNDLSSDATTAEMAPPPEAEGPATEAGSAAAGATHAPAAATAKTEAGAGAANGSADAGATQAGAAASSPGAGATAACAKRAAGAAAGATPKKLKLTFDSSPEPISLKKILMAGEGVNPMREYIKELIPCVLYRLQMYLTRPPAGSFLESSARELREHQPLAIKDMKAGDALTTFREAFSFQNAQRSLGISGLYEAAGNLFWLDVLNNHWEGTDLQGSDLTWTQLVAARTLWDRQALIASCPENESLRRLTFPSFLPSAVGDLSDMKGDAESFYFQDTPLFSGHAIVTAWYEAMDENLQLKNEDCHGMIKHLFQAALSVPIRYRLSPSTLQVQLDSLNYSEILRQAGTACIDSFWDFAVKVKALQPLAQVVGNPRCTAQDIVNRCTSEGLRYKGKEVTRHTALALDALAPFISDTVCCSKYKRLESVTTVLNDCTKLYKLAQATSKSYLSTGGSKAATGAFGTLLDMIRLLLQTNSLQADALSLPFLLADRQPKGTAGFVHMVFKKLELVDYLENTINNQPLAVSHVTEIKTSVFPVLLTLEAATHTWVEDLGVPGEEVGDAENNWQSATSAGWEVFKKTLTPIAASFAELLYNVWGGEYDEELTVLAGQALAGPWTPWHKYLEGEQKSEAERSALQEQWNTYTSAVMAKPKAIGENRVAADAIDASTTASDGMDESTMEGLQKTICDLRKRKVTFSVAAGTLSAAPGAYLKALTEFFAHSRIGLKWKRGKDEVRILLLSADLFHKHAEKFGRETSRGVISSVADEFSAAIRFLVQKKETQDILIVANGRSRAAEAAIVSSDLFQHKDANAMTIVYQSADPKQDARISKRAQPLKGMNTEILHVVMPALKTRALKPRKYFNKCGEATTFEPTLTGVPHRPMPSIPRVDKAGVDQILGRSAAAGADVAIKPHIQAEIDKRGHPLFWAEYKSMQLFKVLFSQFDVTHVLDITPGSGAAAAGALSIGANYDGFCVNTHHKQWLDDLMDCTIFALAVESDEVATAVGASKEHVAQIKMFFSAAVKGAKRYLAEGAPAEEDGEVESSEEGESA